MTSTRFVVVVGFGLTTLHSVGQRRPTEIVAAVETRGEAPVLNLTTADFIVQVDGEPTAVENLARPMPPVAVIVMADQSPSMAWLAAIHTRSRSDPFQKAIFEDFLPSLSSGDEVRLGKIASDISVSGPAPLTRSDLDAFLQFWAATRDTFGDYFGSPIWDGIDEAVRVLAAASSPTVRRLVIVMTDGRAIANRVSVEEVAERAVRAHVAISIVAEGQPEQVRQDRGRTAAVRPDRALRWLAETTGGIYLPDATTFGRPRDEIYPGRLFARAVTGHRNAYSLKVMIPDTERPKTLSISVRRPNVVVRAAAMIQ